MGPPEVTQLVAMFDVLIKFARDNGVLVAGLVLFLFGLWRGWFKLRPDVENMERGYEARLTAMEKAYTERLEAEARNSADWKALALKGGDVLDRMTKAAVMGRRDRGEREERGE